MRAYELHGVNDLRREDIEKPEIPSGWVLVHFAPRLMFFTCIFSAPVPRISAPCSI